MRKVLSVLAVSLALSWGAAVAVAQTTTDQTTRTTTAVDRHDDSGKWGWLGLLGLAGLLGMRRPVVETHRVERTDTAGRTTATNR